MKSISLAPPSGSQYEQKLKSLLDKSGVNINGTASFDVQVHNPAFFHKVLAEGSVGLGESYMNGWWDCKQLDELFAKLLASGLDKAARLDWGTQLIGLEAKLTNLQNINFAGKNAAHHYNLGNELFAKMLDKRMTYTCGYWKNAKTLDEAQEAKLDLTCKKLYLEPGMHILDIGCGWGSLSKFIAENYDVKVTAINVSDEQLALARERCKGLPINLIKQDYRNVEGEYDRIVSLGMFEHVGLKNYRTYFEVVHRCLKNGGLSLLHTIGGNISDKHSDPWISKYIFPNCLIPSLAQIAKATEEFFVIEDLHNFGPDYDKTLMEWHKNFNLNWQELKSAYDEKFFRMWNYYLLSCAGSFRSRHTQLWQLVFSKNSTVIYQALR
ncbi:cyclopropane-fatty-acyl-phospholipid synthase [Solitalea longa]|uniref:Cyclopropane-fatty-acyl-phospholipid synthase n=1 Tax=Solitalea longa TaxID=2079460 RepID=A0A2S5A6W1_9SPHI|nr:cyclopropane fatty acyl phospholipid synthase [Solitalea longa]POY38318.1 cyclopropane-fatty-acyl-phospholipid synthase [Solitalea longa]